MKPLKDRAAHGKMGGKNKKTREIIPFGVCKRQINSICSFQHRVYERCLDNIAKELTNPNIDVAVAMAVVENSLIEIMDTFPFIACCQDLVKQYNYVFFCGVRNTPHS
jgi:hypothetical protein